MLKFWPLFKGIAYLVIRIKIASLSPNYKGGRFMPSSRTIVSMQVVGYLYDEAIILRVQHAWLALIGGAI